MILKRIKVIDPTSIRQFIRDYRLPITATVVFVAVVLFMMIGRLQEQTALGQILAVNSSGRSGYANLLSKDKSDLFTKNDVDDTATSQTGRNQPVPGSGSSQTSASLGGSVPVSDQGGTNPEIGGGTTTPNPTPNPVFSASITDFRQDKAPELQCSNGSPNSPGNLLKCNKIYSFAASVQTFNGPGSVAYGWLYSMSGSANGSYDASVGTSTTTIKNAITLSCKNPGNFTAQFIVTSPNSSQSQIMQINHNCSL